MILFYLSAADPVPQKLEPIEGLFVIPTKKSFVWKNGLFVWIVRMLNHDTDYLTLNLDMELEARNKTVLAKKNINNFEDRYVMLFIQVRRENRELWPRNVEREGFLKHCTCWSCLCVKKRHDFRF